MYVVAALSWLVSAVLCQGPQAPIYRLPTSITPLNYMLRLEPDLESKTVDGGVMIELKTTNDTNQTLSSITLHLGVDSTIEETSVMLMDYSVGVPVEIGSIKYDDYNTLVTVALPEGSTLSHNNIYMISFKFTSLVYSEPKGMFAGSFNSTSMYLASYFRPTYARNVFPCFDEPQYKVPVTLQLLRPATYHAVFTAPLASSTTPDENNMVLDTFQSTGPVSIHSLGLFVSQISPVSAMGVNLYAPAGTNTSVPYLSTLLGNISSTLGPFPVAPLNLVVLPDRIFTSFASYGIVYTSPEVYSGSMPNLIEWPSLKLQLTEAFLQQFLEYAQTPQWWSELWLSESVGAYLATTFQPEPLYQSWLRIVIRSDALGADFDNTIGPVVDDLLLSRDDIESVIANQTIRNKGLSLLTMWSDTMPPGLVTKTILDYIALKKSVVTTMDLVTLMVSNINADKSIYDVTPAIALLASWLISPGYPFVSYSPQSSPNFTLSQSAECSAAVTPPLWPVSISSAQNTSHNWMDYRRGMWLLSNTSSFMADAPLNPWTVFNLETAPYRLHYGQQWDSALSLLQSSSAPDQVKAMLLDDVVALSLAGCVPFPTALSALSSSTHNQLDWYPVAKAFEVYNAKIGADYAVRTSFSEYAATIFSTDLLSSLSLTNSSSHPEMAYVRALLTPWLCQFNISTCRQDVVTLSTQLLQGNTIAIDTNDLKNVICYGARYGGVTLSSLMNAYQTSPSVWLHQVYTMGLGCFIDSDSVQGILMAINNLNSTFPVSDATQILVGLAGSVENSAAVVDFLVQQAANLQSIYGVDPLLAVIKTLAKFQVDLSKLQALTDPTLGVDPAVMQASVEAMAKAEVSAAWWATHGNTLISALPAPPQTTPQTTPPTPGTTTPANSTTSKPSSASSLMDFRVVSLVVAAALMVLSTSL